MKAKQEDEMKIYSPAFQEKMPIPEKYTCEGSDISIPLAWEDVPEEAISLALIMDDPDAPAGTWVHWVAFNIPASARGLTEDQPKERNLPSGGLQGINTGRRTGYAGPCPPGGVHRYFFKLYALDCVFPAKSGITKEELLEQMQGHILSKCEFFGTYQRKSSR